MDVARLVEGLHTVTADLAKAVAGADPEAKVPTCPEWPLRVLVGHVGQAHRWAAETARGEQSPRPDPFEADPGTDWSAWLRDGAAELTDAVLAAGDRPVWTFFGPGPATFWLRRMLHDTIVHHADAALATGAAFEVAPDLATEAIAEWLDVLTNPLTPTIRPEYAELNGTGQTIAIRPGDGPAWLLTRTPDGPRIALTDTLSGQDVTLSGPVADLLLVLTRRLSADHVTVTGDRALIDHWLAHTAA
jgi:uncharacterized protein (TIGR03083 family)